MTIEAWNDARAGRTIYEDERGRYFNDDAGAAVYQQLNGERSREDVERSLERQALEDATLDSEGVKAMPRREHLVDDIAERNSLVDVYGPSGDGKSFFAIDLACCVASETPWQGRDVFGGAVIYVVAEGAGGIGDRLKAWEQHNGEPPYLHPIFWVTRSVNLYDKAWTAAFVAYCTQRSPVLVVLDTLARCMVGGDENAPKDMGIVVEALDWVRRATGACVAPVHHTGKDRERGARGHSSLKGAVDTEIEVTAADERMTIKVTKQKNAGAADPIHLDRVVVGPSCVLVGSTGRASLSGKAVETLAALREAEIPGGIPASQWMAVSGVADRTFFRHRALLLTLGKVRNVGTEKRPMYVCAYLEDDE